MSDITAEYLASFGVSNAAELIAAHKRVLSSGLTLPLALALAMTEKESYKNRMVYGHDSGGYFNVNDPEFAALGVPLAPGSSIKVLYVTETNFREYYDAVFNRGRHTNGVGCGQLTWRGYLTDAAKRGLKIWQAEDNDFVSFEILAHHLINHTIPEVGRLYRYGSATATDPEGYGDDLLAKTNAWQKILDKAPVTPPAPVPTPAPDFTGVRVLRYKSRGKLVLWLSNTLERLGFEVIGKNTTYFSRQVEAALLRYQRTRQLEVDGVAGPKTWSALYADGYDARTV